MRIRWFWFDHVPPGLELAPAQRGEMKQMAKRLRADDTSGLRRERIRVSLPYYAAAVATIGAGIVLNRTVGWFDHAWYSLVTLVLVTGFHCYLWDRTNGPYAWQALREMGLPVCPGCGYYLKGLDAQACPECGWNRENKRRNEESGNEESGDDETAGRA